jgi:hypothetical protein
MHHLNEGNMKKQLKTIFHPIVWIFDNLGLLVIFGIVIAMVTTIERYAFHIPSKYGDVILIGNITITILMYLFAYTTKKVDYEAKIKDCEERLDSYIKGIPTEEEGNLYETELKEIGKKYYGEEAFHKMSEFIIKKRFELMLDQFKK